MLYRSQLNIISNRDLWRSAANTEVILLSAVISQLLFLPLTTKSSTLMSTDKHDLSHQDRLEFVFEFLLKRFRIVLHFKLVTSKFDFDTHTHTHTYLTVRLGLEQPVSQVRGRLVFILPAVCCKCLFPYWTFPGCHLYTASGTGASLKRHNGHYETFVQSNWEHNKISIVCRVILGQTTFGLSDL